jgi:hypothetical protein
MKGMLSRGIYILQNVCYFQKQNTCWKKKEKKFILVVYARLWGALTWGMPYSLGVTLRIQLAKLKFPFPPPNLGYTIDPSPLGLCF